MRQAEEILEIAMSGAADLAILIDWQGGVRMIDPAGWSLSSLQVEYGAKCVYKVERRAGMLRVEGWDGTRRCTLERCLPHPSPGRWPICLTPVLPATILSPMALGAPA